MAKKMKLFQIDEVTTVVVAALDEKDAERAANECDWGDPPREQKKPKEIKSLNDLPGDEWVDAIPIGRQSDNPDELTCRDILDGHLEAGMKPIRLTISVLIEAGKEEEKIEAFEKEIFQVAKKHGMKVRGQE